MKTTIEVSEELLQRARRRAAADGVTMRSVFEQALQSWLDERDRRRPGSRLRDARFHGGGGTEPLVDLMDWGAVRSAVDAERRGDLDRG